MEVRTETYFTKGNIVASSGKVRVYLWKDQLFLEIGPGHNLWALESEYKVYMEQFKDKPRGNCLEIGLGLGVASRCILTFPKVTHLTTVEKNEDVIKAHELISPLLDNKLSKWLPRDIDKHTIINDDGLHYLLTCEETFDFIFLDFYTHIDEDTLKEIKSMVTIAKYRLNPGGTVMGWLDPYTPPEFFDEFDSIFNS